MKYILFLSLLILSFSAQTAPTCSKNGTRVIYTNGISTSYDDADDSMAKIKRLIFDDNAKNLKTNIDTKHVEYELAYNYEETFAKDILEAAVHRLPSSYLNALKVTNAS